MAFFLVLPMQLKLGIKAINRINEVKNEKFKKDQRTLTGKQSQRRQQFQNYQRNFKLHMLQCPFRGCQCPVTTVPSEPVRAVPGSLTTNSAFPSKALVPYTVTVPSNIAKVTLPDTLSSTTTWEICSQYLLKFLEMYLSPLNPLILIGVKV